MPFGRKDYESQIEADLRSEQAAKRLPVLPVSLTILFEVKIHYWSYTIFLDIINHMLMKEYNSLISASNLTRVLKRLLGVYMISHQVGSVKCLF